MTRRRPLAEPAPERWHILLANPKMDLPACAWLQRIGAVETWRPTETKWRTLARGKRRKVQYQKPIAPGYVFALFDRAINWDVMFEEAGRRLRGVVGVDGIPYICTEETLAQMQQVPQRIEVAREAELARRKAEAEAQLPRPGGKAELLDSALKGKVVDVLDIHAGIASFILNGIKGTAEVTAMRRIA